MGMGKIGKIVQNRYNRQIKAIGEIETVEQAGGKRICGNRETR